METSLHSAPDSKTTLTSDSSDGAGLNGVEVSFVAAAFLTAGVSLVVFGLRFIPDFMGVHL